MNKEEIIKILSKIKDTVGENNYKLALAITGHKTGKIKDIIMCSKDGELLLEYIEQLEYQVKSLKEQLEKKQNPLQGVFAQVNDDMLLRNCGAMQSEINEYKTQQKEFIKYLEDNYKETQDIWYIKILQKYKEIIGGKE